MGWRSEVERIPASRGGAKLFNYESEGRTFESFRARHFLHKIQKDTRISRGRPRLGMRFSRGFSRGIFLVVGLGFFASPPGGRPPDPG